MHAETAYLFRHALLRDAAYQLQLPGDRARMHEIAFEVLEDFAGGRPPEPPGAAEENSAVTPHAADPFAFELATHARLARTAASADRTAMDAALRLYLRRGAEHSERVFQSEAAVSLWQQLAEVQQGVECAEALRRAAAAAHQAGWTRLAEPLYRRAAAMFRDFCARRNEGHALIGVSDLCRMTARVPEAERVLA